MNTVAKTQKAAQDAATVQKVPFCMIPQADLSWVMEHRPAIIRLFFECWLSDPYGIRWMPLDTKLKDKTLKQAKAALRKAGLFDFKSEMRVLEGDRYYETLVINLHGSRRDSYWNECGVIENPASSGGAVNNPTTSNEEPQVGVLTTLGGVVNYPTNVTQDQQQQGSQDASSFSQHLSSSSSTSPPVAANTGEEDLKLKEKKENASQDDELLKWVMEVKIPSLELDEAPRCLEAYAKGMIRRDGDALRAEFAEVLGEREFQAKAAELTVKVEARAIEWRHAGRNITVFHDLSGMPAVILDGSVIAASDFLNKPIEQSPVNYVRVINPENAQKRKTRQSRLKIAAMVNECPGFDFLVECWGDILLRSQVKALITKHPEWRIEIEEDCLQLAFSTAEDCPPPLGGSGSSTP